MSLLFSPQLRASDTQEVSQSATMSSDIKDLLKLFERPYRSEEPTEGTPITFGTGGIGTRVGVGPVTPDLGFATSIPKGRPFSPFMRSHRRAAKDLCDFLMRANTPRELTNLANSVRVHVNEMLFIYGLSFVILRKPALRQVGIPSVVEIFPSKFAQQEMLTKAQQEVQRRGTSNQTEPIVIDQQFTGTIIKPEHRVSYWREDYGLNSHHWHWHLVFPVELDLKKDRKGELFFYMHQQMLARYDMERLSVGLNRVLPLSTFREPLEHGYFSKMTINNSARNWGGRQDNTTLKDVRRDDIGIGFFTIKDLEVWYDRIIDAVHQGYMIDRDGGRVLLSDDILTNGKRGIDLLGDAFEADAELSVNYPFYGDVHNFGHMLIAFCHDPDFAHKEEMGPIGDPSTSLRDPVFYNLHKFVDNLFEEYKMQQRPYSREVLNLEGIKVGRIGVRQGDLTNNLETGWNTREFEAGRGLDFYGQVPVNIKFTHLDHKKFDYYLDITNNLTSSKEVTVRIFMAPTLNEIGNKMSFMEQRILWAEMDKFSVVLTPGDNSLVRSSMDSSITAPLEQTFRELEADTPITAGTPATEAFGICGCGWPQHLLLPRGLPEGMDYQLYVMLTDYELDKVDQPTPPRKCNNAVSYCGILDAKFPDGRPMGFPFDRRNEEKINNKIIQTAQDFTDQFDNMLMQDIKITFTDAMLQ